MHCNIETHSEEQTRQAGAAFAHQLAPGTVVALVGPLGSGKTCFARGMIAALQGSIATFQGSPTFALVQEYAGTPCPVYHFDFYRIKRVEELYNIGWLDYCGRGYWCVVEWADRFPEAMPSGTVWVRFSAPDEQVRHLAISTAPVAPIGIPQGPLGKNT